MEESGFRQRFLEHVCQRRGALTSAFVLSGLLFFLAVTVLAFADLARASRVIAVIDVAISGLVLAGSALVLRACNRFQRRS